MDKKVKIILIIILIVIFLGICIFVFSKNNEEKNIDEEENLLENSITTIDNSVYNEVDEEIVEDPVEESEDVTEPISTTIPETTYQSQEAYEKSDSIGTTDKKEEAINLVKNYWGPDNTVTFRCDSITTNGEYIIAVTSKQTATVSGFFRVNLENKTVTVEF